MKRFALLSLWMMLNGCATTPPEMSYPDDALQNAVSEGDCRALYKLMDEDVHRRFGTEALFCHYYDLNRVSFDSWARKIHDRILSGDYGHYGYLPDDPEGAMRLVNAGGSWAFESPMSSPKFPGELKEQFLQYVWSQEFVTLLRGYLARTDPVHGGDILSTVLNSLRRSDRVAQVEFDGPFAKVTIDERVAVIFLHKKSSAAISGAWELYRCYLSR